MKFSIVIPSYLDAPGLWYTVAACLADLEQDFSRDEYEIIAVLDGPEDDETRVILGMRQQDMCKFIRTEFRTPQKNRHAGLLAAAGEHVFFLDSHVIPSHGFFKQMLASAKETGAAILHAGHCFWNRQNIAYGYNMDYSRQFWASTAEPKPQNPSAPYRIAIAGHGAICVDKKQYLSMGGYWDELNGWAGEEPQLNLKAWMLGHEVFMEPRVYHWHFMPNKRHMENIQMSMTYARNFFLVAYASGGQRYLDSIYQHFTIANNGHATLEEALKATPKVPYDGLYAEIPKIAHEERAWICSGKFGGNLDALRQYFAQQGIPH